MQVRILCRQTTFERCSAELAKNYQLRKAKWKLVIDMADEGGGAKRRLPTPPAVFAQMLTQCAFTNGADATPVLALYTKTANAVLGSATRLNFVGVALSHEDPWCSPSRLAEALNCCRRLELLQLAGTQLDDEGAAALAGSLTDGALPLLKTLDVKYNRFGERGVHALCSIFARGVAPELKQVNLSGCLFGDEGAVALAASLSTGTLPSQMMLILQTNDIGDEGAKALAAALLEGGHCGAFNLMSNRFGLSGQSAILKALEANRGFSFRHSIGVSTQNPPLWPPVLSRWLTRGRRRISESADGELY